MDITMLQWAVAWCMQSTGGRKCYDRSPSSIAKTIAAYFEANPTRNVYRCRFNGYPGEIYRDGRAELYD